VGVVSLGPAPQSDKPARAEEDQIPSTIAAGFDAVNRAYPAPMHTGPVTPMAVDSVFLFENVRLHRVHGSPSGWGLFDPPRALADELDELFDGSGPISFDDVSSVVNRFTARFGSTFHGGITLKAYAGIEAAGRDGLHRVTTRGALTRASFVVDQSLCSPV